LAARPQHLAEDCELVRGTERFGAGELVDLVVVAVIGEAGRGDRCDVCRVDDSGAANGERACTTRSAAIIGAQLSALDMNAVITCSEARTIQRYSVDSIFRRSDMYAVLKNDRGDSSAADPGL
jgi:hypothetical protein